MSETKGIEELAITIVEPSSTQWRIIEKHLQALNVTRIDHFTEGSSALEDMRKFKPDLAVSSMHLPDMTGTDLVQAMRQDPALDDIPFMLISSELSDYYLEPLKQAGVIAILPKPFEAEALKRALYSTMEFIEPSVEDLGDFEMEDLRVLVVDDSPSARKHISRVLNGLGIEQITEAVNGKEAAALIDAQMFDMLVTDYNMPEMDGNELTRYIRENSTQASIPILMVTSESDSSQLAGVRKSGVSALCDKPFEPTEVKSLIRKILTN